MNQYVNLAISDFKLIFRDTSLRVFLFLPILIFVVVLWILPMVNTTYELVQPYIPYILIICVFELTQGFSFIYCMVLIDEKETGVSKVYGVVPVEHSQFTLLRFVIPFVITVLMILILLMIQPFYDLSFVKILLLSFLGGLIVPVYILGVTMMSKNRLEGMIWVKAFNIMVIAPIAAFFVSKTYAWFFGILPTHWFFQSMYDLILGNGMIINWGIGLIFFIILIFMMTRKFVKVHFS